MLRNRRGRALGVLCAGVMMVAVACGDDDSSEGSGTTITWWHNSNNEPGRGYYEQVAKDFEADHPDVDIKISAMAHEDMVDKLDAAFQSGDIPDIYMERGGGELADHVEAGHGARPVRRRGRRDQQDRRLGGRRADRRQDLRTAVLPWRRGLLVQHRALRPGGNHRAAGDDETICTPTSTTLEDAGITPLSVGAGDKWPAAHYWYYTALRSCSQDVLEEAVASLDFSDPCFVRAGEVLEDLLATEPFNPGFLTTKAQEGATSASGLLATEKVAMELQGHWEPGVMQGLTDDGQGLGRQDGLVPVPGGRGCGQGDPTAPSAVATPGACRRSGAGRSGRVREVPALRRGTEGLRRERHGRCRPTPPLAARSSDPALARLLKVRDEAPLHPAVLRHGVRHLRGRGDERRDRAALRRPGVPAGRRRRDPAGRRPGEVS